MAQPATKQLTRAVAREVAATFAWYHRRHEGQDPSPALVLRWVEQYRLAADELERWAQLQG